MLISHIRVALVVTLFSSSIFASSAEAEIFTLTQALALAYESNPQIESQRAALRASDEEVAKALAGWRPSVATQGSAGFEQGQYYAFPGPRVGSNPRDITVTISQPLFRGDTIGNTNKAKAQVEAGRDQLLYTEESVLLNGITAYLDVVRYQQIVNFQQDAVHVLQNLRDTLQYRVTLGELSRTDLAQTEGRLNGARADLTVAEGELAASRATFEHVVGRPAESLDEESPFPVVPENYEKAVNLALQGSPILLYAREQAMASDYAVDAAVGSLLPSLSLQGQYQSSSDQVAAGIKINSLSIMAQLTVPLFQGGQEYAGIREAKEQRGEANFNVIEAERQMREQIRAAIEQLRNSQAGVKANQAQVASSQLAFEGVQQETVAGTRTTLDVLIAEQDLVSARVALVTSQRNAYVAAYQLLSAVGGLTAKALNLPVKFYDPQEHYDQDADRWIGLGD